MATILIDLPSREISSAISLAKELSQTFDTYIDDQDGYFYRPGGSLTRRARNDTNFIIVPSYDPIRTKYLRIRAIKAKVPLILYHTEQIFSPEAFGEKLCKNDPFFCEDVAAHLVWGKFMAFAAVARGVDPERIFIVGNIRISSSLTNTSKNGDAEIQNKKILLPTSFDVADYSDEEWQNFCTEYNISEKECHHTLNKKMRLNWLDVVLTLAKTGAKLRVRTHPGESLNFYKANLPESVELSDGTKNNLDTDLDWCDATIISNHSTLSYDLYNRKVEFIMLDFGSEGNYYPAIDDGTTAHNDFQYDMWDLEAAKSKEIVKQKLGYFIEYNDAKIEQRVHLVLKFLNGKSLAPPKFRNYDVANFLAYYLRVASVSLNYILGAVGIKFLTDKIQNSESLWVKAGHSITHFENKNNIIITRKMHSTNTVSGENFEFRKCGVTKCWLVE